MHLIKIIFCSGVGMWVAGAGTANAAELYIDSNVDIRHEGNIGRGELKNDQLSDNVFSVGATANYFFQLGKNSGATLKAFASYDGHNTYRNLDHLTVGGSGKFSFKPNLSYTAPWYEATLKFSDSHYPDSRLRDNYHTDIEAVIGKRFTDRIVLKAGLGYSKRDSNDKKGLMPPTPKRNASVFDTKNARLFLGSEYRLGKLTAYTKFQYEVGDIISTRTQSDALNGHYSVWYWDDDIGPDREGNRRWAYRIDGNTRTLDLGLSYALKRSTSIDLLLRNVDSNAAGNNNYDNYSAHLGLFYRWK